MSARIVRTICPYCGVGCGVIARVEKDGAVSVSGDPEHPANLGRLCSKGSALGETLSLDDRLLQPMIGDRKTTWDIALDRIANTFKSTIAEHGPDSIAFYVSGQLLTEDYYVANKLMKGFIGSANIDTNSRLCMASSVAGHRRAFGSDTVPGTYEDFEAADLVVLVGSNMAWCHPVLYQRLAAARAARGTKVVVIDPRRTATCEIADLHLGLAPGTDVALFSGLLAHLAKAHVLDTAYLKAHTHGFDAALQDANALTRTRVAKITGLSISDIKTFYELFAATQRVVTAYSQGVNQSTSGTDKVNAIINCHLATGRIGNPGMGPFSLTGQPNAMGGREVGGLANMLAAHMDIENAGHRAIVQSFWASPRIATATGPKAVEMFRRVADRRIKALWIMATNPIDSMPEADAVRDAIRTCDFVVVSDVARHTDTTAVAHVLLPSTAWGEKDGSVTNSERRISRQRAFLKAPGNARADWWQMAEVARRMGFETAFAYETARDIFVEHAALSGAKNNGSRDFDISALSRLDRKAYDGLQPTLWPQPDGEAPARARFFEAGGFYTTDRRARLIPTPFKPLTTKTSDQFPLVLNTGRIRDQWHTMTRTGKAPRLLTHIAEPQLEIHPDDAADLGIVDRTLCVIASTHGSAIMRATLGSQQRRGSVFAPLHWTGQWTSHGRIDAVVRADTDPFSGQPGLKQTRVAVRPFNAIWYALVTSMTRPAIDHADHWVLAKTESGWRAEFAGLCPLADASIAAHDWLHLDPATATTVMTRDDARNRFALAAFDGPRLIGTAFIGPRPLAMSRSHTSEQVGSEIEAPQTRFHVLAGRAGAAAIDRGPIVCSCFGIGSNQIRDAIATQGCSTVASVGEVLKAGTNCGSCRPEIAQLIADRAKVNA